MGETRAYLIPKKVTTRLELLPGVGVKEALFVGAGLALCYGLWALTGIAGLPTKLRVAACVIPATAGFMTILGPEEDRLYRQLLRMRAFRRSPQRFAKAVEEERVGRRPRGKQPEAPQPITNWYPVQGVRDGVLLRKDGVLVAGLRLDPVNQSLLSAREQEELVEYVHQALNGIQHPVQILSIFRPLELDQYVADLEAKREHVSPHRRMLLQQHIQYIKSMVSGSTQERRFYLLIPHQGRSQKDVEELLRQVHDLANRLKARLNARVCDHNELLGLLEAWGHPGRVRSGGCV